MKKLNLIFLVAGLFPFSELSRFQMDKVFIPGDLQP